MQNHQAMAPPMPPMPSLSDDARTGTLHRAVPATLPSPMAFLNAMPGRPKNEMACRLLMAGPAPDCRVPGIQRLALDGYAGFRRAQRA